MTDKLPPNLLALFAPRPPLRYLPHNDYAPHERKTQKVEGVAAFLEALRAPDPDFVPTESWLQKKDRKELEKKQEQEQFIKDGIVNCTSSTAPHTAHQICPETAALARGIPYVDI